MLQEIDAYEHRIYDKYAIHKYGVNNKDILKLKLFIIIITNAIRRSNQFFLYSF